MNKMREEFEAWLLSISEPGYEILTDGDDGYVSDFDQFAWYGYQAAAERYQPKWVSASDAKPNHGECVDGWGVLAAGYHEGDECRYENIFYDSDKGWWTWNERGSKRIYFSGRVRITHWMYQPPAPKEQDDD